MKTSLLSKLAGAGLGLLVSIFLSSSAQAGPGLQYWQSASKPKMQGAEEAKPAATATHYCAGSQVVPVTSTNPSWPNARGPWVTVQTGTKHICYMCPVTSVAMTNAWPNHRGPLTKTETTKVGAAHDCGSGCVPPAKG